MRANFRSICVVFLLGLCAVPVADARVDASVPQVRGQKLRDFVRLTFEWSEPTLLTAKAKGNDVILTFDRKANPNMGAVLKKMHPYITKAERKADGKTIVLTLDRPHRIRSFVSDNISGIDLLDVAGDAAVSEKKATTSKEKKLAKNASKKKVAEAKQVKKQGMKEARHAAASSVPQQTQEATAAALAKLAPAAGEAASDETKPAETKDTSPASSEPVAGEPSPAEPVAAPEKAPADQKDAQVPVQPEPSAAEKTEAPAPAPAPAQEPAQEAPSKEALAATAPPEGQEAKTEHASEAILQEEGKSPGYSRNVGVSMLPMSNDQNEAVDSVEKDKKQKAADADIMPMDMTPSETAPTAAVEASQEGEVAIPLQTNKIVVSADLEGATLRFPLKQRTAVAVFIRESMLWVVFGKKLDFDLSDFDNLQQSVISKGSILPHDQATILRIPISDNIYPVIKQQEGQLDFAILLSANKTKPSAAMDVTVNIEPPAPPHVFVPALEVGDVVEITDPDIGDHLLVVPVYTREQGIAVRRGFVEFVLLASTQGVVVKKKADATEITALRNGLRISLPKGAHLSPQLSKDQMKNLEAVAIPTSGTLFPDKLWALETNKSYKVTMQKLFYQTVFASSEGEKNLARLRMAQIQLRQGFVVEAIGMLDLINRSNPSYYRSAKLSAMRGAANFLLYRFNDAARDFGVAELNNNPEITYWRAMIADLLGSPGKKYDFLAMNKNYISKYPAIFRQRLAIVAADRMIGAKEQNMALKIFDTLAKDDIIAPIQSYVDFLTAKISAETGREQEAMTVWKRLAEDDKDKFVQARAEFSTILWDMDNNILMRDQAIEKLEKLRLSWHGDGLELQIVQMLGDLYSEKQDYVNAMRVWQIGVTGFRNTGPAVDMARRMEDTFTKIFSEGMVEKMTPLEALSLYYEYRNYSPSGMSTQVIERLADRLAGVDLLSTASQLLEQHMRTQMEKSERSRVGAKLASVYLANNQPKKALKALQDSVYGDNPILLRIQRNQLTAEALSQQGRAEEALNVLGQDESVGAERLRTMIYWEKKDWSNVAATVENIFKKRADPSASLTDEEGEFALRLALAYVFQDDDEQLQYMRDYFGPLMRGNRSKEAFQFITSPDVTLTTRNFDDLLQSLSKTRGFVTQYKARLAMADSGVSVPTEQP